MIRTGNAESVRITADGHLGIGTASPGAFGVPDPLFSLDIRNPNPFSIDTIAAISSELGQAGLLLHSLDEESYVSFGNESELGSASIILDRNTKALHFCVAGTFNCQLATEVRLTIVPSGNLGVGTKTPASSLQVIGYAQLDLTSGAPPATDCDDASERGRMKVDAMAGLLYVCFDGGWAAK